MTTYGNEPAGTTTGSDPASTGGYDASGFTPGSTGTGDSSTTDKAKETAATAADQGKQVAGTAKDEALNVAGTAAAQARTVVGEARQQVTSQLSDQATTGRDKLAQTLVTLGDDLQQMAQGEGASQGLAKDLAQEVSDRVRALGSHLEDRDPAQLLDDARDFARRRPGTFLLGALAAGVVAGRMFRATADGAAAASLADSGTTGTPGTTYGSTGVGTGPMATASGDAPLAAHSSTDSPGTTGYDTPATDPAPSSLDPTTSGLPGQRTQDTP
ncbi:hypothetical protein [Nocardioides sp. zg-1228]|uniref:hypothetical protein n=1 Tax=Nocardioides sp. zg-1228 TaxID=2763008 RepID=UPI00164314B8|nr:hypothetical protein [Nocardioides sp. zg-1228]MBC2933982.1 hypothetical protein [Nocardioides sp. zg-1228]QSF58740.1 hypothetical protein JX575_06015 [Nocardioides sp. zg-1228]